MLTAPEVTTKQIPLVVDLDGTLIKTDLLWEIFVRAVKKNPPLLFVILLWWMRGRAFMKQRLAQKADVDAATLPYNENFLIWLREQKSTGRKIILATASDLRMASPIADHIGIFDEVIASDGITNLRGKNKLQVLERKFGVRGFDYAGNSSVDFAVWRGARAAIVVGCSSLAKKAADCTRVEKYFESETCSSRVFIRSLRPHQWVKNLIIFAPIVAAHKSGDTPLVLRNVLAFGIFCLCASGIYIINDLMDLDADRVHQTKSKRPLASGNLPLATGLIIAPVLLAISFLGAVWLSWTFAGVMAVYLILTTSYSLWLKRVVLLDVFVLAGLYTMRLIASSVATVIENSSWMLMFSMFIFLSLALVKRYVELQATDMNGSARGYKPGDLEVVTALGTGSGYLSALVLALYVDSQQVILIYQHPKILLLICPLMFYWVSRVWLMAHRGQMQDDPVIFALKDGVSYVLGLLAGILLILATGLR